MSEIPPLQLLQTIEAVTRLGSFKRAAAELFVTPSAISHRVRQVEEQFGKHLFEREGQGVRPTKSAVQLADAVAAAQSLIVSAWRDATSVPENRRVRLCCMAAFAERFILSDVDDFKRKFPDLRLDSTNVPYGAGGMRQDYDILIGIGPYPNEEWQCVPIQPMIVRPIVATAARSTVLRDGMLFGPLLSNNNSVLAWDDAAEAMGLKLHPNANTITFDSIVSACSAAERGAGVALAPVWIADDLVASGSVISLAHQPLETKFHYWLATRKGRKLSSVHERFERWLRARLPQPA
jgi:DNA-binding transcriptional LysR family regulator